MVSLKFNWKLENYFKNKIIEYIRKKRRKVIARYLYYFHLLHYAY